MSVHDFSSGSSREPLMTKRQAADYLKKSTRWIELQVRDRGMPYIQVGGQKRFRLSDIQRWLDDHG